MLTLQRRCERDPRRSRRESPRRWQVEGHGSWRTTRAERTAGKQHHNSTHAVHAVAGSPWQIRMRSWTDGRRRVTSERSAPGHRAPGGFHRSKPNGTARASHCARDSEVALRTFCRKAPAQRRITRQGSPKSSRSRLVGYASARAPVPSALGHPGVRWKGKRVRDIAERHALPQPLCDGGATCALRALRMVRCRRDARLHAVAWPPIQDCWQTDRDRASGAS